MTKSESRILTKQPAERKFVGLKWLNHFEKQINWWTHVMTCDTCLAPSPILATPNMLNFLGYHKFDSWLSVLPVNIRELAQVCFFFNMNPLVLRQPIILTFLLLKAPFTRERNGTERCGTVPENKEIFAGVHTRTTRNVPFRSEKWTALKSEP